MAMGDIRRGPVENLPRRKRQAQSSQTVDTYVQGPAPSAEETTVSRIAKGLFEFSGKALDYAVNQEKNKIELDKVTQQQRALQGLDPTDDATNAGIRAYQLVNIRDDVLQTNADLAETLRTHPDMTDEEYEIATREAYAPLLEKYQGDAQLSQALSNRLQESQIQVHQIRTAAQREHRDWERQESFKISIEEYREAAQSPAELSEMINGGQLENEARALGITPEAYRTGLIQMAAMDADNGDGRLLQAIDNQSWARNDDRVQKAKEVYQEWDARNNAVQIGTAWGEIQEAWTNRTASWEQTAEAISRINNRFPGAITANQVAGLRQRAARVARQDSEKANALTAFYQSQNGDRPVRLGTNPLIPKEHRDYIINKTSEQFETIARQRQASGDMTPEQAESWVMEQKLKFGRQQGIEMPGIAPILESLSHEDPSDWAGGEVPEYFIPALRAASLMNDADIDRYGKTERERNMLRQYQRFTSQPGGVDQDAWRRSYGSVDAAEALTPEQRSTLVDSSRAAIDDTLDRSWWQSGSSVPEGLRAELRYEAEMESMAIMSAGGLDFEKASELGAARTMNRYTILDSGSYVNRNQQQLINDSAYMGEDGTEYILQEADIAPAFNRLFEVNKEAWSAESFHGSDLKIGNVRFEVTQGGLIQARDDLGEPLIEAPISLRELSRDFIEASAAERAQTATEKAEQEAETNARNMNYMNIMNNPY